MPMSARLLRPRSTGFHPEAQVWRNAVIANGGTVSGSTLTAVSNFCRSIDAAGIRDRFYRLNLFAGTGLSAALVPLFRGTSRGGTQYGGATDTNNNFVSGDYTETGASGGLIGNGTSKYLNTGLAGTALPQIATGHISFWTRGGAVTSTKRVVGGQGGSPQHRFFMDRRATIGGGGDLGTWGLTTGAGTTEPATSDATAGMFAVSRASATSLIAYKNAVPGATVSTSIAPVAQSFSFFVFANSNDGSPDVHYEHRLAAYSIGDGLTGAQMTSFYNELNTFMGALSRK